MRTHRCILFEAFTGEAMKLPATAKSFMAVVDKFGISLVREAVVALEANTFVEPQPEIYAEREAKLLGIDPTIPGVAIIPND